MMHFNLKNFETLCWRIKISDDSNVDMQNFFRSAVSLIDSVMVVCRSEIALNTLDSITEEQEQKNFSIQNTAFALASGSIETLNRLAEEYCVDPVYTGDINSQDNVLYFCLEVVNSIFKNRRRDK